MDTTTVHHKLAANQSLCEDSSPAFESCNNSNTISAVISTSSIVLDDIMHTEDNVLSQTQTYNGYYGNAFVTSPSEDYDESILAHCNHRHYGDSYHHHDVTASRLVAQNLIGDGMIGYNNNNNVANDSPLFHSHLQPDLNQYPPQSDSSAYTDLHEMSSSYHQGNQHGFMRARNEITQNHRLDENNGGMNYTSENVLSPNTIWERSEDTGPCDNLEWQRCDLGTTISNNNYFTNSELGGGITVNLGLDHTERGVKSTTGVTSAFTDDKPQQCSLAQTSNLFSDWKKQEEVITNKKTMNPPNPHTTSCRYNGSCGTVSNETQANYDLPANFLSKQMLPAMTTSINEATYSMNQAPGILRQSVEGHEGSPVSNKNDMSCDYWDCDPTNTFFQGIDHSSPYQDPQYRLNPESTDNKKFKANGTKPISSNVEAPQTQNQKEESIESLQNHLEILEERRERSKYLASSETANRMSLHHDTSASTSCSGQRRQTPVIDVEHMICSGVTVAGFKPRAIIRKRRKSSTPQDSKDSSYWQKRRKNNDSARKSRECKKEKEKNFYRRALALEYENYYLHQCLNQAEAELLALGKQFIPPNFETHAFY